MENKEAVWLVIATPDFEATNSAKLERFGRGVLAAAREASTTDPHRIGAKGTVVMQLVTGDFERIVKALQTHLDRDASWLVLQPGATYAECGHGSTAGWLNSRLPAP